VARCLIVQHAEPETAGAIGEALEAASVALDVRRVFAGDALPESAAGLDGLVVMGGPMSAHLDEGFPSRRHELALLSDAVAAGIPVMGVCLGAQLLALAGGGAVFPGEAGPEIGWGPVRLSAAAQDDPLFGGLPDELTVLHWHADTFRLGDGTVMLASTARYPAQAFRLADAAWGLQFHVEVDGKLVERFVTAFSEDAAGAADGAAGIRTQAEAALAALRPVARTVTARFASLVARSDR
jgi:GMP synthase-like glutamine amidotransferase